MYFGLICDSVWSISWNCFKTYDFDISQTSTEIAVDFSVQSVERRIRSPGVLRVTAGSMRARRYNFLSVKFTPYCSSSRSSLVVVVVVVERQRFSRWTVYFILNKAIKNTLVLKFCLDPRFSGFWCSPCTVYDTVLLVLCTSPGGHPRLGLDPRPFFYAPIPPNSVSN